MEVALSELRHAAKLCELARRHVEDMGFTCESSEVASKRMTSQGLLFVVPDEDLSTLDYAADHLDTKIESLLKSYEAGFARSGDPPYGRHDAI